MWISESCSAADYCYNNPEYSPGFYSTVCEYGLRVFAVGSNGSMAGTLNGGASWTKLIDNIVWEGPYKELESTFRTLTLWGVHVRATTILI